MTIENLANFYLDAIVGKATLYFRPRLLREGATVFGHTFGAATVADTLLLVLEQEPIRQLVRDRQMMVYEHVGFWHPMDTLRDKAVLEDLWASGQAPWKVW